MMDPIQTKGASPATLATGFHSAVSTWFKDEEFYWRSLASYIWLAIIFPILFLVFIFCVNISLFSPFAWLIETFSMVFTFSTISSIILLQTVSLLATIPHARALSVQKSTISSNMKLIIFLLRPKQLFNFICFTVFSFLMVSMLKPFCFSNSDNSLFLSFFALFIGICYTVSYYKNHSYVAEFPVIQQTRWFRFKKELNTCLHGVLVFSLKLLQMYYVLNVLTCLLPMAGLPQFMSVNNDVSLMGVFSIIFNVSLLLDCFCISMVIISVLHISNILVKIFNTQTYTFPITATVADDENKTLADAMESSDMFLKHLACLDYNILSRYQKSRRLEMFDLSPPGNQAHCWNRTSIESLKIIQEMRSQLIIENGRKLELKLGNTPKPKIPNTVGSHGLFSAPLEEPKVELSKSWFASPSNLLSKLAKSPEEKKETTVNSLPPKTTGLLSPLPQKQVLQKTVGPAIDVFEHLQITLWSIEAVCNLAAASLAEDKYGVVQKKLPEIIEELLLLLEACEVFWKSLFNVPSSNHSQHVEAAQVNTAHATTLKLAVKTGLYTITAAFGYRITSVRLATEHKKRLHAFLEFAE